MPDAPAAAGPEARALVAIAKPTASGSPWAGSTGRRRSLWSITSSSATGHVPRKAGRLPGLVPPSAVDHGGAPFSAGRPGMGALQGPRRSSRHERDGRASEGHKDETNSLCHGGPPLVRVLASVTVGPGRQKEGRGHLSGNFGTGVPTCARTARARAPGRPRRPSRGRTSGPPRCGSNKPEEDAATTQ